MRTLLLATAALAAMLSASTPLPSAAQPATAGWTVWQASAANSASGTLRLGPSTIGVEFSGPYAFVQTTTGTDFWTPSAPYVGKVVSNPPLGPGIVALGAGGTKTIAFSRAVVDPLIALVSWNDNTVEFGRPIEVLSTGAGFWGNGTPVLSAAGTGFVGNGEVHGVIRIPGIVTSITFTDTSEYWHGFTVGVLGVAKPSAAGWPAPELVALLGAGLVGRAAARRRRATG